MKIDIRNKYFKYFFVIFPYVVMLCMCLAWLIRMQNIKNSTFILVDKNTMQLSLYNYKGELIQQTKVATGKKYGNKTQKGDMRTPEGVFKITEIENSSAWKHDFKDDSLGEIAGAYGPYFLRLEVPGQKGIGIHGTHDTLSLGSRASEGCIRVKNEELEKLVKKIRLATVVIITPSQNDVNTTADTLKKNNIKTFVSTDSKSVKKEKKQIIAKQEEKIITPKGTEINKLTPKKKKITTKSSKTK